MPFQLPDLRPAPDPDAIPDHIDAPLTNGASPSLTNAQRQIRDQLQTAWAEPLTNKQRKFVSALFGNGFNQIKAAKAADPALSNAAAARKGRYWYSLPAVQHAIEVAYTYFDEAQKVRWEDIVGELRQIAFSNIMDFHIVAANGDPIMKLPKAKDDPRLRAIAEISTEDTKFGTRTKLKMYDKLNALDKLIKLLDPTKSDDAVKGSGVTIQNINIVPVPAGQFLPAQQVSEQPLLEVKDFKPLIELKAEPIVDAG